MIKKYKNIIYAYSLYLTAILLTYVIPSLIWSYDSTPPSYVGSIVIKLSIFMVLIGIFFGFKSIKSKESKWAGHLAIVVGGLVLASPIILSSYAFWGLLYNIGIKF